MEKGQLPCGSLYADKGEEEQYAHEQIDAQVAGARREGKKDEELYEKYRAIPVVVVGVTDNDSRRPIPDCILT